MLLDIFIYVVCIEDREMSCALVTHLRLTNTRFCVFFYFFLFLNEPFEVHLMVYQEK